MQTRWTRAVALWALLLLLAAPAHAETLFKSFADFDKQTIALQTGTVFDIFVDPVVKNAQYEFYNDLATQAEAVSSGKAAACALDEPVARLVTAMHPELAVFPAHLAPDSYSYAVRKGDPLAQEITDAMRELYAEGLDKELAQKWFSADESMKTMPDLSQTPGYDGSAGEIRMGVDLVVEPMMYGDKDGRAVGYEMELMERICVKLNKKLVQVPTAIQTRIEALLTDQVDVAGCCLSITEERKLKVDFTDPYYIGGAVLVVRKDRLAKDPFAAFAGKKIGVLVGSMYEPEVRARIKDPEIIYYDDITVQFEAVKNGLLDASVTDEPLGATAVKEIPELALVPEYLAPNSFAIAVNSQRADLMAEFDEQIIAMKAGGTLDAMRVKWFGDDDSAKVMPAATSDGHRGIVRMATNSGSAPFAYMKDGQIVGYEIELAQRICDNLGYTLEVSDVAFTGLITSIVTGKVDLGAANITVTEERKQSVLFTESTYDGGTVLVVRASDLEAGAAATQQATEPASFWAGMQKGFQSTFVAEDRWQLILGGLWVTLQISFASILLGTLLGFGVCQMRRSRHAILSVPARVFIRVIQGMPIVVLLMILAFVVFLPFRGMSQVLVAIIGFTLNFGAYVAEMLRAGLDAVDKNQLEAADAIGFSRTQIFTKIAFPQAARHALPVYKGEVNSQVKATSIVGYIAVMDLTKVSDIIRSRTYDAFFPLLTTAVIYFILANLLTSLLTILERNIDPKRRARTLKGVTIK